MNHELGIIDRDNETPVAFGLKSLDEAKEKLLEIKGELDGGWKIVDFTTGKTLLTDQD